MKKLNFIIVFLLSSCLIQAQPCVGVSGEVTWEMFPGLPSGLFDELDVNEDYPINPSQSMTLFKLQSPLNFDNFMGARMTGFISVPASDNVQFNITGNERTRFYLSTDESPSNLQLMAFADAATTSTQHTKFSSQTSPFVALSSGNFYYFEIIYTEGIGHDHCQLYWKTNNVDPNNWTIITTNFIHKSECLDPPCPLRGSSCDDNDASTANDMEDGYCNCIGTPMTNNVCIGERSTIKAYAYDGIPGRLLANMYADPNYPGMPNRSLQLDVLGTPGVREVDSTGHLIQGFLNVPITGNYRFNLTGDETANFKLANGESLSNGLLTEIYIDGLTAHTEHDKFPEQTSLNVNLVAGQYYFYELNHKERAGFEHYTVYWQTPFTQSDQWKKIPKIYCYGYECEIACIPQGTPCEDGNPFTNNDQYDNNCTCVGTPCSGPDCDDLTASYVPFPKCDVTDQLDNREDSNWLSCEISNNPNPGLPDSHWVRYDFGKVYNLNQSHVWNYNVAGDTQKGFQNVQISYRRNGGWKNYGTFTWPLADGTGEYQGFAGPDFGGLEASHLMITSLDDPAGNQCRGFGKFIVDATHCPNLGEACDDGEYLTFNDTYDENCNCVGESVFNACDQDTTQLLDTLIASNVYSAVKLVESANLVETNGLVIFIAGEEIDLIPGFEVESNADFHAFIESCDNLFVTKDENPEQFEKKILRENTVPGKLLTIIPIPNTDEQIIQFHVGKSARYTLKFLDQTGNFEYQLLDFPLKNKGYYHKRIRTKKLDSGVYNVVLSINGESVHEKLVVM